MDCIDASVSALTSTAQPNILRRQCPETQRIKFSLHSTFNQSINLNKNSNIVKSCRVIKYNEEPNTCSSSNKQIDFQYYRNILTRKSLLSFNYFLVIMLICLLFISSTNADESELKKNLPICSHYQACAAEVAHFPLISETVGEIIEVTEGADKDDDQGSGEPAEEGSGEGVYISDPHVDDFPLYDEFVTSPPLFDYNTDAELSRADICRCPSESEESNDKSNSCDFDASENIMRVDKSIRLAFCRPTNDQFKLSCMNRRALVRIIGEIDPKTGDALTSINDTAVFCNCESPSELRRIAVEPWLDKYAFVYRCIVP